MPKLTFSGVVLLSILAALIARTLCLLPASRLSFLPMTFAILTVLTLAQIIWSIIIYPKYWSPLLHFPGPKSPSLLMGHFFPMLKAGPGEMLRAWVDEIPNEGIIRYLDFLNLERLAIVSPAALADILVHKNYDFEKPAPLRKGISRILGVGLFLAEGEVHKMQRKHLTPAFSYRNVKNLYPMFWDKSSELVQALLPSVNMGSNEVNARDGARTVEVNEWASRATLDIIGQGGFGHSFDAIKDPNNELNRTYRGIFAPGRTGQILGVVGFLLPQWLVRRLPWLRNDKMKRASDFVRTYCYSLLASKRRQQQEKTPGARATDTEDLDILTVALASNAFLDDELVDQMMTFLAAGHETTASALTWAIYILAKHPQMQSRLRHEVQAHLPSPFATSSSAIAVTAEMIEQMPYLNAICREVLRLFPPVALTIRVAIKDTSISGHFIPQGTTIILPPWAVNASSALWGPDALEFRPERWMQTESSINDDVGGGLGKAGGTKASNYALLTFLHGPRSCIGQTFAIGELKCLLAAWVGAFETNLRDDDFVPVISGGITAKPKDGLHVKLRRHFSPTSIGN